MADYDNKDVVIKKLDVALCLTQELCRIYKPTSGDALLDFFSKAYRTAGDAVEGENDK